MNKYRRHGREVAEVVCKVMNLMYKKKASSEFKEELISSLNRIEHKNGRWVIK